jgi:hypothetical protein
MADLVMFVQHCITAPLFASILVVRSNIVTPLRWECFLLLVVGSECSLLFLVILTPFG